MDSRQTLPALRPLGSNKTHNRAGTTAAINRLMILNRLSLFPTVAVLAPSLIAFAAAARGDGPAPAEPPKPSVTWSCPHSVASSLSSPRELPIQVTSSGIQIEGLDSLLAEARANPSWDYTSCLNQLLNQTRSRAFALACTDSARAGACNENLQPFFKSLGEKLALYSAEASRQGAVLPFEAGAMAIHELGASDLAGLKADFNSLCQSGASVQSHLALDRSFITDILPGLVATSRCPAKIAQNYGRLISETLVSGRECSKQTDLCQSRRTAAQHSLELLASAGLDRYLIAPTVGLPVAAAIDLLATDRAQRFTCVHASSTPIDILSSPGTGSTVAKYRLERLGDRTLSKPYRARDGKITPTGTQVAAYRATVNLAFNETSMAPPGSGQRLRQEVQSCYEEVRDRLRGPNGEFLDLALYQGPQDASAPPLKTINVGYNLKTLRQDTDTWGPGTPCHVMIHETMHYLGLPDEYPEDGIGKNVDSSGHILDVGLNAKYPAFDCRAIAPGNSVMSQSYFALEAAVHSTELEVALCRCASGDCGITGSSQSCPKGAAMRRKKLSVNDWKYTEIPGFKQGGDMLAPGQRYSASEVVLKLTYSAPTEDSLLFGGQFRAITEPGCTERNSLYMACARESTKTSRGNYGNERCGVGVPEACFAPDHSWVNGGF